MSERPSNQATGPAVMPAAPGEAPGAAHHTAPAPAPIATPTSFGNHEIVESVSEINPNSHSVAFETPMSEHPRNLAADANVMIAQAKPEAPAAAPDRRRDTMPAPVAAPAPSTPTDNLQSSRMADPRDKLLWADAMRRVAAEMTAGLSAIPPAYRKQQQMRAKLLSSAASEITMFAGRAPVHRPIVTAPKVKRAGRR